MLKWFYQMKKALQEKISEKGQGMVEYALVLAAVAIIAAFVLSDTGGLKDATNATNQINSATGAVGGSSETTQDGNTGS